MEFDGLFISNGPGDPDTCDAAVQNIRKAMQNEKLCGEPGIAFVADSFIRTIVHIDEKRFPVFCQRADGYGVSF